MTFPEPTAPAVRPWQRIKLRLINWVKWFMVTNIVSLGFIVLGLWLLGAHIGLDVQRLIGQPACMPTTVYLWRNGMAGPPKVGEYVVARMPDRGYAIGARPGDRIVKKIMAVAGDQVKVSGTELFINGKHVDRLWLAKSIPGKAPGDFDVDITLREGQLFLMGTTQESFDSRYWGAIEREQIIGSAIPLF